MQKYKKAKEKSHKFESKTIKSISLSKNKTKFLNSKRKEKNEDKKVKIYNSKNKISLKNNEDKKEKNEYKKLEKKNSRTKNENKKLSESEIAKYNTINSINEDNKKFKNIALSKNLKKENNKLNKNKVISHQNNKTIEIQKEKGNYQSNDIEKVLFTIDDLEIFYRNKETLSTNYDTSSTIENKIHSKHRKKIIKTRNNNRIRCVSQNKKIKINFQKEISNSKNNDKSKEEKIKRRVKRLATVLTPIPLKKKEKVGNQIQSNEKDVQNAKVLRRKEYDEYIKNLNKKKSEPKPIAKPAPKKKIYDIKKVNTIQKIYRGFQTRDVNQIVNRLKVNLCSNELICLILNKVFIHAKKRITFSLLKLYYHEPFHSIYEEVNFTDRIYIKLSDRYYNFNNFVE